MCCSDIQNNPRARRINLLANLILVLGLLPRILVSQPFLHAHPVVRFCSGLLIVVSITMNVWFLWHRRSSRPSRQA